MGSASEQLVGDAVQDQIIEGALSAGLRVRVNCAKHGWCEWKVRVHTGVLQASKLQEYSKDWRSGKTNVQANYLPNN